MSPKPVRRTCLLALAVAAWGGCKSDELPPSVRERPNILLIVADDLGYSDLGAYGGEIPTPQLDALAKSGLKATKFYVAPRGAPTRAMLLTGVDNNVAGIGGNGRGGSTGPEEEARPERLGENVVTVASLLRGAGYRTVMAGKWELGLTPEALPHARGFEHSFVLHDTAASHWSDMTSGVPERTSAVYTRDGEPVTALPEDYFSTAAFTDFAIEQIEAGRAEGRPFFAYLAFQAPHGPLAAPGDWKDRFAGRYDVGFDTVRTTRLLKMKRLKLVREDVVPYPGIPTVPRWKELSAKQQKDQARRMELYAAMVANMDFHVGRVVEYLKEIGEYQDTVIVFLSDNGAEPGDRGPNGMDGRHAAWYAKQFPETDPASWGLPGSFIEYGPGWAQVSSVPFRLFKGTEAEGGIRSPLIVAGPGIEPSRRWRRDRVSYVLLHVMDLTPTFLELAGVEHPDTWQGRPVAPLQGKSLVARFAGGLLADGSLRADDGGFLNRGLHDWLGFGYAGERALRKGHWKAAWIRPPLGAGGWRLYQLDRDPAELWDRSEDEPQTLEELTSLWAEYAKRNGIAVPAAKSEGAGPVSAAEAAP